MSRILRVCRRTSIFAFRRFAEKPLAEPKFSESAAFKGKTSKIFKSGYKFDYYATDEFERWKLLSFFGTTVAVLVYFGLLREPSDLDELWSAPEHVLTSNVQRKMLRNQIQEAKSKGQDASLLEAELDFVDVKEAAWKIQFDKSQKAKN
ncbi:hypothetical protein WR25_14302 [Diploscapter pachys]|uniref:Uncharacterized protein n=1 Tax=Diploscapter pachys TaxID=2018661 RepID=A0A2A2KGY9_9BILA|nr:hypothetical protein WR25_14302 [Diploscapter pachys]